MNKYFRNTYECGCGNSWEDEWDSTCDDRCSICNTSISPSHSIETGLTLALHAALDMYDERLQFIQHTGDDEAPDYCDRWADECFTIFHSYPDFWNAHVFKDLAEDLRDLAEELRAEDYGA